MLRVAVISGSFQPQHCGVAHYTAHLSDALAEHHVNYIILTTHTASQIASELPPPKNSTIVGAVNDWNLANLFALVNAIHITRADILHIQHAAGTYGFNRAIFLLPLLLKITGWRAPIVTTVHEYGWWEWQPKGIPPRLLEEVKQWGQQRGWWDREDGFLLTQSHAIITTNHEAEQVIIDRLPHLKSLIHRIPIGANVGVAEHGTGSGTQARHLVRDKCNWSDDTLIIAFFGFLHPVKGLETLLPAFKQVLSVQPQARLLLVGGVETLALPGEQATRYWHQLQTQITDLGLDATVYMTGYLKANAVSQYLCGVDIGILPFNHGVTLKSGSLLTLMSHALPMVITRSHPPDPELHHDDLVLSIAPRNVHQLKTAVIELLNNPIRRQQLGAAGYQFSRQFAWSSIAKAHLDVYRTVLSSNVESKSNQPLHSLISLRERAKQWLKQG